MDVNQMFESKYLKSADLIRNGRNLEVTVVIDGVQMEGIEDGGETKQKPILYFQGKQKGMVMNRTNGLAISEAYGGDSDAWHGKQIILFVMKVQGPNGITDGLRVRIPPQAARPSFNGGSADRAGPAPARQDFADDPRNVPEPSRGFDRDERPARQVERTDTARQINDDIPF